MKQSTIQAQIAAAQKEVNNWPPSIKSATKINGYSLRIDFSSAEEKKKKDEKHEGRSALAL